MKASIDYFENLKFVPAGVAKLSFELGERMESEALNYADLDNYKRRFHNMGYTFDYGLDAVPRNLRKI